MEQHLNKIYCIDSLEFMKTLPDKCIDLVLTDPPYGLEFMGKDWDKGVPGVHFWKEMLRVLKPGGYLLSFGGTRTYHRMACAIEDAGFEVRDMIEWVYGSGFPKSLNIGKAVDNLQGNEREDLGEYDPRSTIDGANRKDRAIGGQQVAPSDTSKLRLTKGTSEWEGWGTALKPAHEPICMARKPLAEKTVAENVLKYGTGGINIDESRVSANWKEERPESWFNSGKSKSGNPTYDGNLKSLTETTVGERLHDSGRFPANLIHDGSDEVKECFPESKSSSAVRKNNGKLDDKTFGKYNAVDSFGFNDSGSASRFFKSIIYQAKASKSGRGENNNHPTVKPTALMEYLIKMASKKGDIILDPFAGSGTTGVACKMLCRNYILNEISPEYVKIAEERIKAISNTLF